MADVEYAREHWDEWSTIEKLVWLADLVNGTLYDLGYGSVAVDYNEDEYIEEFSNEASEPSAEDEGVLSTGDLAAYDHEEDTIVFDQLHLEDGDFDDVAGTALHEVSHVVEHNDLTEDEYHDPDDEDAQEEAADCFANWWGESIGLRTTDEDDSETSDGPWSDFIESWEALSEGETIEYTEDEVGTFYGEEGDGEGLVFDDDTADEDLAWWLETSGEDDGEDSDDEDKGFVFDDDTADEDLAWWLENSGEDDKEMSEEQAEDIYGDDMSAWLEECGDDLSGVVGEVTDFLKDLFNGASP